MMIERKKFIKDLESYKSSIPKQTYKTIRGQALAGDLDGAMRGLRKVLERERIMNMELIKWNA
jgi:hypothetical protein